MALTGSHRIDGFGGQGIEIDLRQRQAASMQVKLLVEAAIDDIALLAECFIDG